MAWVGRSAASKVSTGPNRRTCPRRKGTKLKEVLAEPSLDRRVEELAKPFFAETMGRPSFPPGVYVRFLLIGYLDGRPRPSRHRPVPAQLGKLG